MSPSRTIPAVQTVPAGSGGERSGPARPQGGEAAATLAPRPIAARWRRSLSLQARLTGVYGLLIAATLLLVAGVSVAVARSHLESGLNAELSGTAQSFRDGPALRASDASELRVQTRRWLAEHPLPAGQMAAIRIGGGQVLTSTGGLGLFEVTTPRALLTARQVRWWTLNGSEGSVRGLTVPVLADGRQLGTLVLLAYEKPIASTVGALLVAIAIASAFGLALALGLGVLAVRRGLRPLTRMAAEVTGIETTGDLSRRLSGERREDEVGRLATAFDRMLARLEEAFRAQRLFLADASHELRTPLTVARGQLELLADELAPQERRVCALATDELDRMARIVDDLLLLARLDEGAELRQEPVEVELVLREALLRAMLLARREVVVEAEPDLYVRADPDRLLQVLTNLVVNAVQHGGEQGRIVLSSERQNGEVLLRVSDNGNGIPADELPLVFERFYRGGAAKGSSVGSGLGLTIASSIVKAMQGTIGARPTSELGGATFTVTLPALDQP